MAKEINFFDSDIDVVRESGTVAEDSGQSTPMPSVAEIAPTTRAQQPSLPGIGESLQQTQRAQQQDRFMRQHAKRIVEALLFASSEPLSFNKIREILDTFHPYKPSQLRNLILELQQDYLSQQRSFRLEEIPEGFLLRTCEEYSAFVDMLFQNKRSERLSQASAEVLAIVAYKNPITRPQIDSIRGVDSSGIIQNLLERQLVEPVGRLEAPGRPTLYGITHHFLKHYGLRGIDELPPIPEAPKTN